MNQPTSVEARASVLVVDDDQLFLKSCEWVLAEDGLGCVTSNSGAEAISLLAAGQFDVLVCDLLMPPPDGFSVIDCARGLPNPPEIVALTSLSATDAALAPLHAAGTPVLFKPVDDIELSRTIASALHLRHLGGGQVPKKDLAAILQMGSMAAAASSLPHFLDGMLRTCLGLTGGDSGSVLLASRGSPRTLSIAVSYGLERTDNNASVQFGEGVSGWVAQTIRPLRLVGSLDAYPQFARLPSNPSIAESLLAPIHRGKDVMGVICISSKRPKQFGPEKLGLLVLAADLATSVMLRHNLDRAREHQDKLAVLGELSASTMHELNNPLSAVKTFLNLIEETLLEHWNTAEPLSVLAPDLPEILKEAGEGIERMSAIIANTKAAARRSYGTAEELNLTTLLRRAEALVHPQFKHRVTLRTEIDDLPIIVRGDGGRLLQVVINLLVNAAQAVGKKGEVTLRGRVEGEWASVEVADNGPGIRPEVANQIFEPFFTTKPEGEGTGLGLSISRQIAIEHQGDLTFTTVLGRGTCFRLRLPTAGSAPAARGERKTVLVVDDDKALLNAMERLFAPRFDVIGASSSDEALRIAQGKSLAVILTDFSMPDQNGLELLQRLRAQGHTAPAIILTAGEGDDAAAAALRSKVVDRVIPKPWSSSSLLGEVIGLSSESRPVEEVTPASGEKKSPTGTGKRKPVLVVDDDQDFREGLRNLLVGAECDVFTAVNGQEALEQLSKIPTPGVILLDLMMPVMSGHQFLRAVESHQSFSTIPVVALTAAPVTVRGIAGFLRKPPDLDELIALVKQYCNAD